MMSEVFISRHFVEVTDLRAGDVPGRIDDGVSGERDAGGWGSVATAMSDRRRIRRAVLLVVGAIGQVSPPQGRSLAWRNGVIRGGRDLRGMLASARTHGALCSG